MHYKPPTFNALFPGPRMRKKHAFNALVCYLGTTMNYKCKAVFLKRLLFTVRRDRDCHFSSYIGLHRKANEKRSLSSKHKHLFRFRFYIGVFRNNFYQVLNVSSKRSRTLLRISTHSYVGGPNDESQNNV